MNDTQGPKLSYFLSEKRHIMIVTLIGPLIRCNTTILNDCIKEVLAGSAKWVILNFRDVPQEMDQTLIPALTRLQKLIRERPAELRISSLHPELRKMLESRGIIRQEELHNNLSEALQAIAPLLQKAA